MEINISTRDLRVFLAVARTLSFSQAAQQMHLSQSALSALVARLEETIGARLFERTTRAVALTAAGSVLALHADELLANWARTVDAVHDVTALRRGTVAVAALPSLAAGIVPQLFRVFGRRYPEIALKLIDTLSESAFDLVRQGQVDIALTAANPAHADLIYTPLTTDSFVLLAAVTHPLGQDPAPIRFADTLQCAHISMTRPTSVRQYVDAAAIQNNIAFHPTYEVDHLATIGAMVVQELGVAALPAMAAAVIDNDRLVIRPLIEPAIRRSIGLVRSRDKPFSPAAQALVAMLHELIADL